MNSFDAGDVHVKLPQPLGVSPSSGDERRNPAGQLVGFFNAQLRHISNKSANKFCNELINKYKNFVYRGISNHLRSNSLTI
jgi:hypothetical protein